MRLRAPQNSENSGAKRKFSFQPLTQNDQIYQTPSEISEILAKNYSEISANSNYDSTFITRKLLAEKNSINFSPQNPSTNLMHDSPTTEHGVISTISKYSKTSAPGFDQISPIMLHNLHPNSISYFFNLLSVHVENGCNSSSSGTSWGPFSSALLPSNFCPQRA